MRKKIVAGNWKMNTSVQEGITLVKNLLKGLEDKSASCTVIVAAPFTHLYPLGQILAGTPIALSAENAADKESGAYTGEVSVEMIKSTGATHVILGHSERRAYYHETPEILKEKVDLALKAQLSPIFCVGEQLEEREAEQHLQVVKEQISKSLFHLDAAAFSKLILAYEPVWAIGTGKTATAEQAQEMHSYIRSLLAEKYGKELAEQTSILYGGSCNASNADELFSKPDVDGGLIGGASLSAEKFLPIIEARTKA